ncbi:hypothetical protein RG931_005716 [Pseudomonas syringae pv. actinidiae]|nr:hypothetical protein BV361_05956 [Pseudomonas syringae pv. actinidiae]OSR66157.1 hypothetical protein BV326_04931 [Pseudomonas syringae pv. actinidiae]BBM09021.1 hypothetical protein KPSA3_102741 [Pseudomonas syringae pv. actinidiae]
MQLRSHPPVKFIQSPRGHKTRNIETQDFPEEDVIPTEHQEEP